MFCPVGFRPASELWKEFIANRFRAIREDAVRSYAAPNFIPALSRGSPMDITEHLFFKSLAVMGFHVASPSGDIMRLHVQMADGHPHLFETSTMYESALYAAAVCVELGEEEGKQVLRDAAFRAWEHEKSDTSKMAEVFSISDVADKDELIYQAHSAPRHTLLHHIQRRSFTLMTSPPFWARDTVSSPYVAPVLEHFAGWALCIDEAAYNERWPEYLAGNVQFYPSESDDDADASASRVGRPPMTAARAAFAEMNYEKGELSWEQIGRQIEQKTGQKPSAKALRTWRADAEGESDT